MLAIAAAAPLAGSLHAESSAVAVPLSGDEASTVDPDHVEADAQPAFEPIGRGMASYYGRELAGARTASGDRFDPAALTAAHRTLPFGSRVQVTNPATGVSVVVTINDRGPFHGNRVIDLSEAAAREIGIVRAGRGLVELALAPAGT